MQYNAVSVRHDHCNSRRDVEFVLPSQLVWKIPHKMTFVSLLCPAGRYTVLNLTQSVFSTVKCLVKFGRYFL